jgi:hypothetical protein
MDQHRTHLTTITQVGNVPDLYVLRTAQCSPKIPAQEENSRRIYTMYSVVIFNSTKYINKRTQLKANFDE